MQLSLCELCLGHQESIQHIVMLISILTILSKTEVFNSLVFCAEHYVNRSTNYIFEHRVNNI